MSYKLNKNVCEFLVPLKINNLDSYEESLKAKCVLLKPTNQQKNHLEVDFKNSLILNVIRFAIVVSCFFNETM